jgi:hypothetical protein
MTDKRIRLNAYYSALALAMSIAGEIKDNFKLVTLQKCMARVCHVGFDKKTVTNNLSRRVAQWHKAAGRIASCTGFCLFFHLPDTYTPFGISA